MGGLGLDLLLYITRQVAPVCLVQRGRGRGVEAAVGGLGTHHAPHEGSGRRGKRGTGRT